MYSVHTGHICTVLVHLPLPIIISIHMDTFNFCTLMFELCSLCASKRISARNRKRKTKTTSPHALCVCVLGDATLNRKQKVVPFPFCMIVCLTFVHCLTAATAVTSLNRGVQQHRTFVFRMWILSFLFIFFSATLTNQSFNNNWKKMVATFPLLYDTRAITKR